MSDVDKWYRDYWARHRAREVMYKTLRARCLSCEDRAELNEYEKVIFDRTHGAERLLDYGGGDNRLKRKFLAAGWGIGGHEWQRWYRHDNPARRLCGDQWQCQRGIGT